MSTSINNTSIDFPALVKTGQRFVFSGIHGSSDALFITRYLKKYRDDFPFLVVSCAQASDMYRLQQELKHCAPEARIHLFPDWETLPYDTFSPHQDLISERLATLHSLHSGQCDIVLISATTALYHLPPPSFIAATTFFIHRQDKFDEAKLKEQFLLAGYDHVNQVMRPGEYSIRGGLIDLFPMGSALPYRLDLFDDTLETIRAFDPDTQRSLYPVDQIRLLPGREFPWDETSRQQFRQRWNNYFEGSSNQSSLYKDIRNGVPSAGIEYYLPFFFEKTATFFDYLPAQAQLIFIGDHEAAIQSFSDNTQQRYRFLSHNPERPVLAPKELFLNAEEFFTHAKPYARLVLKQNTDSAFALPLLKIDRHASDPLAALRGHLQHSDNHSDIQRVLITTESPGRRETIYQLLVDHHISKPVLCDSVPDFLNSEISFGLAIAPFATGFRLLNEGISIITENDLYGEYARHSNHRRREKASSVDTLIRDLAELKINDPIVHSQHGVGRYLGLVAMDMGQGEAEFLHLAYANEAKLYVPVGQLHLISRYSGTQADTAPLHMLGSPQWEKAKKKAAQQIHDTAAELLELYSQRAIRQGHAFQLSPKDYEKFSDDFGFEETPDQTAAIAAVIKDMTSGKPMDRLVCGDVGFGKTEVALRAAFIAAMDGKQIALLAPTTLLAEQHYQTFRDRFSEWPIQIAALSRFKTKKEINASVKEINAGKIDIVIGTHALLSSDIQFKRLGLVIIDEEHRFGVRQKEALKALRAEVDILTMTATPIPRTLGMALEGLRDFSVIATAPQKRLSIKTFVRREENGIIREAILRELNRGGQVYFLHNEVETIANRHAMLTELIPEARIAIAHGQMHEKELEQVMRDFVGKRTHILLCTTIIETGIDVPTANTILIHRSDKFGLAQLHQLRGRVGRSHHQAYAYLLVHDPDGLTPQAQRRLEAIQELEELGSGFYLAMHDLEIRGVGEVLGDKQSGEIHEIGFQLYTDMLNKAIKSLKAGEKIDLMSPLVREVDINLHRPALLPNDFCPDVQERLALYKRLASCHEQDDINDIKEEIIDRFGKLPDQAQMLIETHRLRLSAKTLGIIKIDMADTATTLQFMPNPPIDSYRLIELVQKNPYIKLAGQDRLRIASMAAIDKAKNKIKTVEEKNSGKNSERNFHKTSQDTVQETLQETSIEPQLNMLKETLRFLESTPTQ